MQTQSMATSAERRCTEEKVEDGDNESIPQRQHTRLWVELDSFQDLFYAMMQKDEDDDEDYNGPAIGEVSGDLIRDADFFSWDFRGDRRVYMLFFMGSCDHFPAIWIGDYADREDSEALVEQMPILYFMTDHDEPGEPIMQTHNNLREYLQDLIDCRRATFAGAELDRLQAFVNTLSEKYIERGHFIPLAEEDEDEEKVMYNQDLKSCTMRDAIDQGGLDYMIKLYEYNQQRNIYSWTFSLNVVEYIIKKSSDNLDCLKFAVEHGCPVNQTALLFTVDNTNSDTLDCLKYLHQECGLQFTESEFCIRAAKYNMIDHLIYAHEHGCPWDPLVCAHARMPMLQYVHEHGCPWDASTLSYSIIRKDDATYQYAVSHGLTWDGYSIVNVIHDYHYEIFLCDYWKGEELDLFHKCIEMGCPVGDINSIINYDSEATFDLAIEYGYIPPEIINTYKRITSN